MTISIKNEIEMHMPEFISNDYKSGRKVLTTIENELANCDNFNISVAFITESGITPLLPILKKLEEQGIAGRILTTNYLTFSEPKALKRLSEFENLELRMFYVEKNDPGFHPKGYMFRSDTDYNIIIGSSNWTAKALTVNKEWNVKIRSTIQEKYTQDILEEFHYLWQNAKPIDEWLDLYTKIYEEQKRIASLKTIPSLEEYKLDPNNMQVSFINNLMKIIDAGENKALLVSATGTGKTYASAFALREYNPRKALFIVHREQIAKQALKSYETVFGETMSLGLISGKSRQYDKDIEFSTVQMMSKESVFSKFEKNEFDVIVIDEVHRAGAESYQKIMDYFSPKLWLGMTASPERSDGYDIFKLFDHNVAYEIRLNQALEEELLCPFYYFGITDLEMNGTKIDDNNISDNFSLLVSDERVDHVIKYAKFYGYSGGRVKGLIFCRTNKEAEELSNKMNQRGFSTVALSGDNSQLEREVAIERLTKDDISDTLDYIFTVDIFNEGIDIPEVNQIIMLRPTESAIIFVQQLGRGLRKSQDKEFVVIIDFIANYKKNFLIPIALSGDRTFNKDNIRRYVIEGTKVIPGCSTIYFDEVSKERIYNSINVMKTGYMLLKEKYNDLKFRLGHIPSLIDFYKNGELDPLIILEKCNNYYDFLKRVEKEYRPVISEKEGLYLSFLSSFIADGKRPHEKEILKLLMSNNKVGEEDIKKALYNKYNIRNDFSSIESAINLFSGEFVNSPSDKQKYKNTIFLKEESNRIVINDEFKHCLKNRDFVMQVEDLLKLSTLIYENEYAVNNIEDNLVLYKKYSRKDVCRLLNWDSDDSSTIYGYRIKYDTCPIFVTYHKKDNISKSTKYEESFINEKAFSWMTRPKVKYSSKESQQIINYKENNLKMYLFINKSDDEGSEFYYIGKVIPVDWQQVSTINDKGEELPIMNFVFDIEHQVQDDIYDYITER